MSEVRQTISSSNVIHNTVIKSAFIKFDNYSNLERLLCIIAFCKRFIDIRICKLKVSGPFSMEEIQQSMHILVITAQQESFPQEIRALSTGKSISPQSKIFGLNPILAH